MEATLMIKRSFNIEQMGLRYYVGINQIRFDLNQFLEENEIKNDEGALNFLFNLIEELQNKNKDSTIQFISDNLVLNQDHIFTASYYMEKAFFHKTQISNKKNIELLIYLSTHRQISKAIESFGINKNKIKEGKLTICIVSPNNSLDLINKEILHLLNASEIEITINKITTDKINRIINYFEISDTQIKPVLNSYEKNDSLNLENNVDPLSLAVFDLICEKMALLNLE